MFCSFNARAQHISFLFGYDTGIPRRRRLPATLPESLAYDQVRWHAEHETIECDLVQNSCLCSKPVILRRALLPIRLGTSRSPLDARRVRLCRLSRAFMSSPFSPAMRLRIPFRNPSLRWSLTTAGSGGTQALVLIYADQVISSFEIKGITAVARLLRLRVRTQGRPPAYNRCLLDHSRPRDHDLLFCQPRVPPFHLRLSFIPTQTEHADSISLIPALANSPRR
jgi:hypothetical protein